MERFENAQVGDLVYCRAYGNGKIAYIGNSNLFIQVKFERDGRHELYLLGGKMLETHVEPLLFYRKGEDRYLTERPEPDIDWSTVEPGTVFLVTHCKSLPYQEREFLCYSNGQKWFIDKNQSKVATVWNHARIK